MLRMIDYFGRIGGFDILLQKFREENLSSFHMLCFMKPFSNCIDFLSINTLENYFSPILKIVPQFYENLSDEELKQELKADAKNCCLIQIIRICKMFAVRMSQKDDVKIFEFLRLKLTLRLLKLPSFSIKMNALNDINKTIVFYNNNYVSDKNFFNQSTNSIGVFIYVSSNEMAQWLIENGVLEIILKDCLHQPQYVEKLENIMRFLLKENALTLDCLDKIWNAQQEKHEIIVQNIHELIAKLAWNFSVEQLNHLFVCFESSWINANKKEREKLLELMRRLAEDDQDGSMATKVLKLLWNIAYNDEEIDDEIVKQALNAHLKILETSKIGTQISQRKFWLECCIDVIVNTINANNNILTAMKQIRDICCLFQCDYAIERQFHSLESFCEQNNNFQHSRHKILVDMIHRKYDFASIVIKNLQIYMNWMRSLFDSKSYDIDPNVPFEKRRFSHYTEIIERLDFLKFFLQEGRLWLSLKNAQEIWSCLTTEAIFPADRQICFQWFSSLMGYDSDLNPETYSLFFETNIIELDPILVDFNGIKCFENFLKAINYLNDKLITNAQSNCINNAYDDENRQQTFLLKDHQLIGLDYLWKLILFCEHEASCKAIDLFIELYTNLAPSLEESQFELNCHLIEDFYKRLKSSYDILVEKNHHKTAQKTAINNEEIIKMIRILSLLAEYVNKCDRKFNNERTFLPMSRCFRGKQLILLIKYSYNRNQEEFEMNSHLNETLYSIKNRILQKNKSNESLDCELFLNNEKLEITQDKLIRHFVQQTDSKMVISVRFFNRRTISCSPIMICQNSSFNRQSSNLKEIEQNLPGVILSSRNDYTEFLFSVADLAIQFGLHELRQKCLQILNLMPPDEYYVNFIRKFFTNPTRDELKDFERQLLASPTKTLYLLEIIYSLLMPSNNYDETTQEFQTLFISSEYSLWMIKYLQLESFIKKTDNYFKMLISQVDLNLCYLVNFVEN
ncbi:hypothetical protein QR98_0078590 [Sarcoptes scabiei]|uniref:Uncharacterized protein n=1 Tax=Sarcoptes scabiei TaxID=52283 RepID=A0A132AFI7_SARSC|nr:hypothetical protein QR98_0078590 [Sarcoptes scabiei]